MAKGPLDIATPVAELAATQSPCVTERVFDSSRPLVIRGLVSHWPVVRAALDSLQRVDQYLRGFYQGAAVTVSHGDPDIAGRVFYNDDMSGFNFTMERSRLDTVLDLLLASSEESSPPLHYIGSTTVDNCLPGFRAENELPLKYEDALVSLWLGNQSRIAAHFDIPDNLACVAAGRRRFTLFPPDQLQNLYIGPLDFAPAGQAISLVDFQQPDFERFPRFRQAIERAQVTELAPGDAIFIPSMWWHHVEGLEPINLLINYWWRESPAYMGSPADVLNHALLSMRDLPPAQREAWRAAFEHYIFSANPDDAVAHIPPGRRGVLGPADDTRARKLRALLLKHLNR